MQCLWNLLSVAGPVLSSRCAEVPTGAGVFGPRIMSG